MVRICWYLLHYLELDFVDIPLLFNIYLVGYCVLCPYLHLLLNLVRAFVEKNYKDLKTLNPKLPILIRESRGIEPQLWARYGKECCTLTIAAWFCLVFSCICMCFTCWICKWFFKFQDIELKWTLDSSLKYETLSLMSPNSKVWSF